jgi:hypothetical protein
LEDPFIENGIGTVLDRLTGLMWQQATAPGEYKWSEAVTNVPAAAWAD